MWPANLWPRSLKIFSLVFLFFCWGLTQALALSEEEVRLIEKLKKAGLSDEAIVEILKLE